MPTGNKYIEHKMEFNETARIFRKGLCLNEDGSTILPSGQDLRINQTPTPFVALDEMDFTQTFSMSMWGTINCGFWGQRQSSGANRKNIGTGFYGIVYSQTTTQSGSQLDYYVQKLTNDLRNSVKLQHVVITNVGSPISSSAATRLANLKVYVNGVDIDSAGIDTPTDISLNTTYWNAVYPVYRDARFNYYTYVPSSPVTGDNFTEGILADFIFCRDYIITPNEVRQMFNRGTNDITLYATHYPATVMANRTIHYSFDEGNYTGLVVTNLANPGTFDATINNQVTPNLKDIY